jgi:CRP/FNR family transcriptional regulator, cyclic AMP receptor protein
MSIREKRAIAEQLSTFTTFADCTHDDLLALVDAGAHFALPPAWSLMHEGVPADACYVITEGTARVFRDRTEVATLGPGDIVGEMALVTGGQRRATVSSVTHVRGLRIEYEALTRLLARRPHLTDLIKAVYVSHRGPVPQVG